MPVVGTDSHLSAVPPESLVPEAIERAFARTDPFHPEHAGDGRVFHDREPSAASVLVPLVLRDDGVQVLLTRRTDHLRDHAGQVSFPGGRAETHDADPAATALREAEEEIGLARERVRVIGALPPYTTITRFVVTPVVAFVEPPFRLQLDPFEVAEAFEVPLAFLMDPAHHRRHRVEFDGGTRQFLSMPYGEHFIWGATAAMLRNLYAFLAR